MLPRPHRMVAKERFADTLRHGSRWSTKGLVVTVAVPSRGTATRNCVMTEKASEEILSTQVGFIVAKKQIPKAVDRNRVRRKLRHLIRDHLEELPVGSGVVIRVLAGAHCRSGDQLSQALNESLRGALQKQLRQGQS